MKKVEKILVAVDFSSCSKHALSEALDLAEQLGAKVDVVHAWASPAYVSPSLAVAIAPEVPPVTLEHIAREEAQRAMGDFLETLPRAKGVGVRLEFGPDAETIVDLADRYDLLVVGTHGRSGLAHLMLGSVAERIVRRSRTPVLTIRELR